MSNFIPQLLYSFQQLSCIDPFLREIRPYNPSVSIPIKDNWDGLFIFSNVNASPLGEPYWLRSLHISTGIGQIPHFYSRSHSALWIDDESKSDFLLYRVVLQLMVGTRKEVISCFFTDIDCVVDGCIPEIAWLECLDSTKISIKQGKVTLSKAMHKSRHSLDTWTRCLANLKVELSKMF